MPRASTKKLYRTFVKGLITEASPLTYPENASIGEDNCIIYRAGNRSRRYGIDIEADSFLSSHSVPITGFNDSSYVEYVWEAVANKADINFLVHQVGLNLYFYNLASSPISSGLKSFSLNLVPYITAQADPTKITSLKVSMAAAKGYLFIVSEQLEPIIVTYNTALDTITSERVYIQIRDFEGVDDGLTVDQEPTTLSIQHKYNLLNQGWQDPKNDNTGALATAFSLWGKRVASALLPESTPITEYFTTTSRYPGNNKQWWVGKDDTGDFDPSLLEKEFFGASAAPRGHFVVDAFFTDRAAISAIPGLPVKSIAERPSAVSFAGGRAWYGLNNTLYFSQILDGKHRSGKCYQEADPTSEHISDLIATDGGVVQIPEMGRVVKFVPSGSGLLVFGNNGVWFISGGSNGFTATDYSVSKISSVGTDSPYSIVESGDKIFYWARVGIQSITQKSGLFGPIEGGFDQVNLTEDTIQSFFSTVSDASRPYVKGVYDQGTNTIQWLFRDSDEGDLFGYNKVLNYDIALNAFYPWTVSASGPQIIGIFNISIPGVVPKRKSYTKYLCSIPVGSNYQFVIGEFDSDNFCDWQSYDGVGVAYNSYVETGYELLEDAMRRKEANYVFCYFRRTEENFVSMGEGEYEADLPSSCYFQVKWAWSSSSISNKWSQKIQAYRHSRVPYVNEADLTFDTGFPIVVTKNKVRGNGRAIQFRFESAEIGSNFDLLGWAVAYSGNTEV